MPLVGWPGGEHNSSSAELIMYAGRGRNGELWYMHGMQEAGTRVECCSHMMRRLRNIFKEP